MDKNNSTKRLIYGLLILMAICAPFFITGNYPRHMMVMCGIWVISSMGLNLILGYVGQLNLAHGTFFGIGAYATALLIQGLGFSFWLALPVGCLITAFLGFLTGLPTLRTRGHYFPISTMCLGISLYYVIARWDELTGGARGLFGIPRPTPIPFPFIGKVSFDSTLPCYYLVLFFVFLTMLAISRFVRSLVGKRLIAIRGNENLAQSVGINTMWDKVVFLSISTLIAGLAGGLYAAYMGSLMAEQAHFLGSFEMLLNVMIGGVGTMAGPFIGGVLLPILTETLHFLGGLRLVVYGVLLILIMGFLPQGYRRRPAGIGPALRPEGRCEMNDLLLEARDLTKNFGGLEAIGGVSFTIRKGNIFSVIGPNGAGKTTLFNLITAFLPPTRGEIFFKGEKISGLKPFQVARKSISRTFQLTTLFERITVLENLMIGQTTTRRMGVLQALLGGRRRSSRKKRP